jgi:glycosyltransferase involved in cell wall biosynthesis
MEGHVRVLSVIHTFRPAFSGEGEWLLRMVPFLRTRGVDVEILAGSYGVTERLREPEVLEGVVINRVRSNGDRTSYWKRLGGIMGALIRRRGRFDIALFHSPNYDAVYASCLVGRLLGWKTVYKMTLYRSDDLLSIRETGKFGRVRLAALQHADGFISISEPLNRTFKDAGFCESKLLKVTQGADTTRLKPSDPTSKRLARLHLGIPERSPVVLFCGAVIYRKGVDLLVEAWSQVQKHVDGAILIMVGPNHRDGFEEPEDRRFSEAIERRIGELQLNESVRLTGYQKEMEIFYRASDVFVLPSRAEGCPNVVAQAMASGLPCIVSQLDGASEEFFRDGESGLIVRSEDPCQYARYIISLLTEEDTARRIGQQARKRAEERFDIERNADSYAAFLRGIVSPDHD